MNYLPNLRKKFDQALLALGRLDSVSVLLPATSLFLYMKLSTEDRVRINELKRISGSANLIHKAMLEHRIGFRRGRYICMDASYAGYKRILFHIRQFSCINSVYDSFKKGNFMKTSDMNFFHQATMRICGSLDIHTVLNRSFDFLKSFIPSQGLTMNIYNVKDQCLVNIAMTKASGFKSIESPIPISGRARTFVESQKEKSVHLINHPEEHLVGRYVWEAMGKLPMSCLVLHLVIEDEVLGVVSIFAKGHDKYTQEHARLFELLHDPFAVALANTLKHQEVLRLKDLLADDNRYLNRQLHHISGDEIIGSNFGLKNVMDMVRQIAPLTSQVMLLGETGAGKEVIANAIHYSSPRAGNPFIKINCGAIPENLIDSELFGHEKGAFTGALTQKRGRFERADKGTLFLDEIGELPLQAQIRLLRVLQNNEIERIGGTDPIPVDIRIITATHRNLQEMIRQGKFREDLWFRLNVFPIVIPPLRRRKSDIPALALYFMERKAREMNFQGLPTPAPGALERLQAHDWPGNVRELENLVERTLIQNMTEAPGTPLGFDDLHSGLQNDSTQNDNPHEASCPPPHALILDEAMKAHIQKVLHMAKGKVQGEKGAAALLGINPSTLRNRMNKLGISYGRQGNLRGEKASIPLLAQSFTQETR